MKKSGKKLFEPLTASKTIKTAENKLCSVRKNRKMSVRRKNNGRRKSAERKKNVKSKSDL